jgi:hypothetical protein
MVSMKTYTVLVVPGDCRWTLKALNLACAMARSHDGQVILLKMAAAGHPALLGSPEGLRYVTDSDRQALAELKTTAEEYNVPAQVTLFAYANYAHALVSAVEQLDARALFATLPPSRLPFWARYQQWRVEGLLARHGCTLHTVTQAGGPLEWAPTATQITAAKPAAHGRPFKD